MESAFSEKQFSVRAFLMEKRNAEKAEASLPYDRLSEPHRQKKLLLRDARESHAAALRAFFPWLRSAREVWQRMAQDSRPSLVSASAV